MSTRRASERAICPSCGRDVALNQGGQFRAHKDVASNLNARPVLSVFDCPGSARDRFHRPAPGGYIARNTTAT